MENEYQNFYEQPPVAENQEYAAPVAEKANPMGKIIAAVVAIAAIIGVILLIGLFTNTANKALKLQFAYKNAKTLSQNQKTSAARLNGLCENDYKQIMNLATKSENYDKEDEEDSYEESVEMMNDEYGKNWKYSYKLEDKDEVKKDDLKSFKKRIKETAKAADEILDDISSGDYDDIADELGISKSQAKKLVKHLKNIAKKLKDVKVTKGYEMEVTETIKGKDEEDDSDETYIVYKVNGRWVSSNAVNALASILSSLTNTIASVTD